VTYFVRITPAAETQAETFAQWWRENRPAAPEAVKQELQRAKDILVETPFVGSPYRRTRIPGVRRIAMNKTPYHVCYRVNEKLNEVVIMAVWSAMRKRGPPQSRTPKMAAAA